MCPSPLSVLDSRPKGAQEGQKLLALAECVRVQPFDDLVADLAATADLSRPS